MQLILGDFEYYSSSFHFQEALDSTCGVDLEYSIFC